MLVLNTMYFADEVREPSDTVGRLPGRRKLPKKPEDNVIDLMSALQESIDRARDGRRSGRKRKSEQDGLAELSKKELYQRAGDLGVSGRSKMSKDELHEAVAQAS